VRALFVNLNRSPAFGGMERWMIDAAEGLSARGHTCVLLGRPGAPWGQAARNRGLRVREDHYGTWAMRVVRTAAVMRAERPDVVVTKGKKAARMAAWGRAAGGGRVTLLSGLTGDLDKRRWIDRHTWRRVDAGILGARAAADWYVANGFGPREKWHLLLRGVDLAPFDLGIATREATRAALGLADGEVAVGTVGRLAWQKGLDRLFEAIRLIGDRAPRARFFVVGEGRERPQVEAAAATLGGVVRLLGQRDDVPALLGAFDVFVQPSRQEVMVQTTLEAMAAGRAIVSTTTVGADEAIEDGRSGVLVPVDAPVALADAIVALAGDAARRGILGRAARARVEETFTKEQMLDRCEAVFRRIAGSA
jgi:glycosyltransferase involved in cell wall biosynthesis